MPQLAAAAVKSILRARGGRAQVTDLFSSSLGLFQPASGLPIAPYGLRAWIGCLQLGLELPAAFVVNMGGTVVGLRSIPAAVGARMRATKPARRYAGVCGTGIVVRLACKGLTFANFALVFSEIGKSVRVFAAAVVADPDGVRGFRKGWCVVMLSYYRTLFDINSNDEGLVGLPLLGDVERALRIWVADYFPGQPDILRDPEPEEKSGRRWETDDALLRFSGGEVGEQGYFWLRWHAGGYAGSDGAGNGSDGGYRRYLGFRLATEGDAVQADVEIRVEDRDDGHFDDAFSVVMDNLTDAYGCASIGCQSVAAR